MKTIYDFAVVGAGPAGSVFARLAAERGYSVLLINRQTVCHPKPCGGLLAPDAQAALAKLGLTLPAELLVDPQIFSVKTIDVCSKQIRYYPRCYLNTDRFAFDKWLLSLAEGTPGVTVQHGKCLSAERIKEEFRLRVGEHTYSSRYLVGADGAASRIRRTFFPKQTILRYTAIQEWYQMPETVSPFYSCIFDAETSESCSWSICKNGILIYGGAFPSRNCRKMFEKQKQRVFGNFGFPQQEQIPAPIRLEACLVSRPRSPQDFVLGSEGVFLIGEAAGFISPTSFEGISSALLSGEALATALTASDPHRAYRKATAGLRRKLLAKCLKRPFLYVPPLRSLVMRSGITAIHPRETSVAFENSLKS